MPPYCCRCHDSAAFRYSYTNVLQLPYRASADLHAAPRLIPPYSYTRALPLLGLVACRCLPVPDTCRYSFPLPYLLYSLLRFPLRPVGAFLYGCLPPAVLLPRLPHLLPSYRVPCTDGGITVFVPLPHRRSACVTCRSHALPVLRCYYWFAMDRTVSPSPCTCRTTGFWFIWKRLVGAMPYPGTPPPTTLLRRILPAWFLPPPLCLPACSVLVAAARVSAVCFAGTLGARSTHRLVSYYCGRFATARLRCCLHCGRLIPTMPACALRFRAPRFWFFVPLYLLPATATLTGKHRARFCLCFATAALHCLLTFYCCTFRDLLLVVCCCLHERSFFCLHTFTCRRTYV